MSSETPRGGVGSLANYTGLAQVGEGMYGYVYRALDQRGQKVALKRMIIHKEHLGFPLCAVREIKFLKQLTHKNIVQLQDIVTSKGCEHLDLSIKADSKARLEQSKSQDRMLDLAKQVRGKGVCGVQVPLWASPLSLLLTLLPYYPPPFPTGAVQQRRQEPRARDGAASGAGSAAAAREGVPLPRAVAVRLALSRVRVCGARPWGAHRRQVSGACVRFAVLGCGEACPVHGALTPPPPLPSPPAAQFPPRALKSIAKQIFSVLDYLAERRIIHRDIKCSNILLSSRHQVKLADFGLARSAALPDGREGLLDMTNNVVTMWYKAPELLLGSTKYSYAVDVWSAGCVLVELFLERPFLPGKTALDQLELTCKMLGSPSEKDWPDMLDLPLYAKLFQHAPQHPAAFREVVGDKVDGAALNLLDRIFVFDAARRCSARAALSSKYFMTAPVAPEDPAELEPLRVEAGASLHEYETKQRRRLKEKEDRERKGQAQHSIEGSAGAQHMQPPPPPSWHPGGGLQVVYRQGQGQGQGQGPGYEPPPPPHVSFGPASGQASVVPPPPYPHPQFASHAQAGFAGVGGGAGYNLHGDTGSKRKR